LRSVNGKGLDIRLRLPDWLGVLEPEVRGALAKAAQRGNVSLGLRIQREAAEGAAQINTEALERVLAAIGIIEAIAPLCDSFAEMRRTEGAALHSIITRQLAEVSALTAQARAGLGARAQAMQAAFRSALERVMAERAELDEARLAQEIAVLAVKSDVAEEIDRLCSKSQDAALTEAGLALKVVIDQMREQVQNVE